MRAPHPVATRSLRRSAPAIALLMLLTGCTMRQDIAIDIGPDGTGRFAVRLALDDATLAAMQESGENPDHIFGPPGAATADGLVEKPWSSGGFSGREFSFAFTGWDDFEDSLHDAFFAGLPPGTSRGVSVSIRDSMLTLDLDIGPAFRHTLDGFLEDANADVDHPVTRALGEITHDDLARVLESRLTVSVPGRVLAHNADRILDNGVLEWDLVPPPGEVLHLEVDLAGNPDTPSPAASAREADAPRRDPSPAPTFGHRVSPWRLAAVALAVAGAGWGARRVRRRLIRATE